MSKRTIIEAQNSNTVYEDKGQSGILGKLKGVFADYEHGTRNSERLYTEELWDNRVFGSNDVMEALETKTLFGELDHPEGDRCETLAKNAAITITKLEKKPEEGVIYGEAEILDTPSGRIVKALADSGAKLGISSRGLGEEIYSEGKNIIDPETYDFITFDVVVTPANEKARVSLTESKHINKLTESINKEIKECETENQLLQMKTVVESIGGAKELMENIDNKIKDLKETKHNAKMQEKNREIAMNFLKEKLSEANQKVEVLETEKQELKEQKEYFENSKADLKKTVKENVSKANLSAKQVKILEDENKRLKMDLQRFQTQLNEAKEESKAEIDMLKENNEKEINSLKENNRKAIEQSSKLFENKSNMASKQLEEENKKLQEQIERNKKTNQELSNKYLELQNKLTESIKSNKQLTETNKQLEESKANLQTEVTKLEENRTRESKIILENKQKQANREQELQRQIAKLEEQQDKFSQLAFNPIMNVSALRSENNNVADYDDEDKALFDVLTGK